MDGRALVGRSVRDRVGCLETAPGSRRGAFSGRRGYTCCCSLTARRHQALDMMPVSCHSPPEQYRNSQTVAPARHVMFLRLPEDGRGNPDHQAVEFGVSIGEYEGVVRVPRPVFRRFIDGGVTPERCIEAYHLQRTRFELTAERKLRRRQLTD